MLDIDYVFNYIITICMYTVYKILYTTYKNIYKNINTK